MFNYTPDYARTLVKALDNGEDLETRERDHPAVAPAKTQVILDVLHAHDEPISKERLLQEATFRIRLETGDDNATISESHMNRVLARNNFSSVVPSAVLGVNHPNTVAKRNEDLITCYEEGAYDLIHELAAGEQPPGADVIFIDECSINTFDVVRDQKLVVKTGRRAYTDVEYGDAIAKTTLSLIVFVSTTRVEAIFTFFKTIKGPDFERAMHRFCEKNRCRPMHMLIDNASTHGKQALLQLMGTYPNIDFSFLPRYSPDVNAAEYVHPMIKRQLGRVLRENPRASPRELKELILNFMANFQVEAQSCLKMVRTACMIFEKLFTEPYSEAVNSVHTRQRNPRQ